MQPLLNGATLGGDMRGQLRFPSVDPTVSATLFIGLLARKLEEAKPRGLNVSGDLLTLRGGMLRPVWNWNLLVPVTSATIHASAGRGEVVVEYNLRMTELLVLCGLASLVGVALAVEQRSAQTAGAAAIIVWGWIFGGNYLITRFRMKSLLRKIVVEASQWAPPRGA